MGLAQLGISNFRHLIQWKNCSPASFSEGRKGREGETRGDPAPLQFLFTFLRHATSPLQHRPPSALLLPEPSSTQQSYVGLIKTTLNPL